MIPLFGPKTRGVFLLWCVIYYAVLCGYFFLLHFYFSATGINQYGQSAKIVVGLVLLVLTAFLAPRVDLLWFNYRIHGMLFGRGKHESMSRPMFYVRALFYYLLLIAGIIFYIQVDTSIYFLGSYYATFLWGTFILYFKDFLIPSFARYERLVAEGKWGMFRK